MPGPGPGYEGRFDALGWFLIGQVLRHRRPRGADHPTLVDLGMGRGRDAIYLSRCGFRVLGIDIDSRGIERCRRRAARLSVRLRTRAGDLRSVRLTERFDVVFSNCALNCLPRALRRARFGEFQRATTPGGVHAVNAFIHRPGAKPAPDLDPWASLYQPGELRRYYRGWEIQESREVRFDCPTPGTPHRHLLDVVVARKPAGGVRSRA